MGKLIGGYETRHISVRIYDNQGEFVLANGMRASEDILETLAIYLTIPWKSEPEFKTFKYANECCCEYVASDRLYDAFICGHGATEAEARTEVNQLFNKLKKDYLSR